MKSRHLIHFNIACAIGPNAIVGHAIIDKKNASVHIHLYGEMLGSKRMPIEVRNSDKEPGEGEGTELIKQLLADYFSGKSVHSIRIEQSNGQEKQLKAAGHPLRIIVRLST